MSDLKSFRKMNNLRQEDIANYLQVTRNFISLIENGSSKLPEDKLTYLMNNDKGWDTTMLEDGGSINATTTAGRDATVSIRNSYGESGKLRETNTRLTTENEMLREKIDEQRTIIAELKAEKEKYWELIQKLMK